MPKNAPPTTSSTATAIIARAPLRLRAVMAAPVLSAAARSPKPIAASGMPRASGAAAAFSSTFGKSRALSEVWARKRRSRTLYAAPSLTMSKITWSSRPAG